MSNLIFILGDQLSTSISSLRDADIMRDIILMAEVSSEATYANHHKQKIALVLSAMRHFARELLASGWKVDYIFLDYPLNSGTLTDELRSAIARHKPKKVVITHPGEWRVMQMIHKWQSKLGVQVEIREDDRFLYSLAGFNSWAEGRRTLRMENFYRLMRQQTGFLMENEKPAGGHYNFDRENRKPLSNNQQIPNRLIFPADEITREVLQLVSKQFSKNYGELEPFYWAVSRKDSQRALCDFIEKRLSGFGNFQDAMKSTNDTLFHSLISPYLNIGLLSPAEVCKEAERAWREGRAALNAVEGFIRQIIGWREYVRGIYWRYMPDYANSNFLKADLPLPSFYWNTETELNCLHECLQSTQKNAYAHHIQRLMVIGNFALLTGLAPLAVEEWYLSVYVDAFEWVEMPNTHGMALFADGGIMASKPYAASGAYIQRMSDYCGNCRFSPKIRTGENACPFNYLYWHFLMRNGDRLKSNPRMAIPYSFLSKMADEDKDALNQQAELFLHQLR